MESVIVKNSTTDFMLDENVVNKNLETEPAASDYTRYNNPVFFTLLGMLLLFVISALFGSYKDNDKTFAL